MALKPNASVCGIREQIIEDLITGITIQFEHMPGSDSPFRLRLSGNVDYGNREFLFDADGAVAGAGTSLIGVGKPSWLKEVGK